jgi:hypothetical protein
MRATVRPWRRLTAGPRAAAGTAGSCRARQTRRSGGTVSPAPCDSRGQARASEQNRSQRTVTSEACAAEYASHCALSTPLRAAGTTTKSGSCWRPMRAAAGTAMPLCSRSSERALSACAQTPDSEHTPTTSPGPALPRRQPGSTAQSAGRGTARAASSAARRPLLSPLRPPRAAAAPARALRSRSAETPSPACGLRRQRAVQPPAQCAMLRAPCQCEHKRGWREVTDAPPRVESPPRS